MLGFRVDGLRNNGPGALTTIENNVQALAGIPDIAGVIMRVLLLFGKTCFARYAPFRTAFRVLDERKDTSPAAEDVSICVQPRSLLLFHFPQHVPAEWGKFQHVADGDGPHGGVHKRGKEGERERERENSSRKFWPLEKLALRNSFYER